MGSADGATCADRTTGRRAHTRAAEFARHGTDSGTIAGTAGVPQRNTRTGTIHGSQDPHLGASVGQTLVRQHESRASQQGERESNECRELLHASAKLQNFLLEFRRSKVRDVQAHHDLRCLAEPPTGRRARDPEIRGDSDVPGALDEISKPVVVALLRACRHGDDHPPFAYTAQLHDGVSGRTPTWDGPPE